MAWTHFTSSLAPGEIITREQRNELYAALDERMQALLKESASGYPYKLIDMDDIEDSDVATRSLAYTIDGHNDVSTLYDRIGSLAPDYAIEATSPALWASASAFWTQVASDLGETYNNVVNAASGKTDCALGWNAIRSALQLLSIPAVSIYDYDTYERVQSSAFDPDSNTAWAAAKTAFFAATPSTGGSNGISYMICRRRTSFSNIVYDIDGLGVEAILVVPDIAPFSNGWDAWVFFDCEEVYSDTFVESTGRLSIGSVSVSFASALGNGQKTPELEALTDTGTISMWFSTEAMLDSAVLDAFQPPAVGYKTAKLTRDLYLYIKPTFTHP